MIRPSRQDGRTGWSELARHPRVALRLARGAARTLRGELGFRVRSLRGGAGGRGYSFADALERRAAACPEAPLLWFGGRRYGAAECDAAANRVAHLLREAGVGRGSRVALMFENHPFFLDAYLAVQKLGATALRVNAGLVAAGLERLLRHGEVEFLVVDRSLLPQVDNVLPALGGLRHVLVHEDGSDAELADPRVGSLAQELLSAAPSTRPEGGYDPHDLMEIKYTSGTTGAPKGVIVRADAPGYRFLPLYSHIVYEPEDVIFTCLPLFHDIAMMMAFGSALWSGASFALSPRFSARRFWSEVVDSGATTLHATGTMLAILLRQPVQGLETQHQVRMVVGSACPQNLWRDFESRFGVSIWEGYGASDSGGFGVMNLGNAPVGSIGRPFPRHAVVDEEDRALPAGEVGELVFYVGAGAAARDRVEYVGEENTAQAKVRDGWLRTGDRVWADPEGYLFFAGRKSDSMRRRGENVSAFEVEAAVLEHPDAQECAAYPVPSELSGDDIAVAVVSAPGARPDAEALCAFLRTRLPRYAQPRYLRFVAALPRTPMQKVAKQRLVEEGVMPDSFDAEGQPPLAAVAEAGR